MQNGVSFSSGISSDCSDLSTNIVKTPILLETKFQFLSSVLLMFQSFCSIRVLNTIDTYVNYQNGFDEHGFTLSEKSYNRIDQLKFKRLSIYVYSPSRCTLGYVGYNLYNSENVIIDPQEKKFGTNRSCVNLSERCLFNNCSPCYHGYEKIRTFGAGVIDIDYIGYIKVVILSHSKVLLTFSQP